MTSYADEERRLEELDYEDEVRAARQAASFDALHELRLSAQALAEALKRRALGEAAEIKAAHDLAQAAVEYAKAAKLGGEAERHAATIKLRAERNAGEGRVVEDGG